MTVERPRPALALIAAVGRGGVIGQRNGDGSHLGLPWHLPEDLRYFRRTTEGHAVIMGRKTFQLIGRPLPKRRNIVLSRSGFQADGVEVMRGLDEAIQTACDGDPLPFVIGGAEVYRAAMNQVTRVYLTEVDRYAEGDVVMPPLPYTLREEKAWDGETPGVRFRVLVRPP